MKKKVEKKVKVKIIPFIIILFILAILFGIFYLLTLLPIKNIYISGNNYINDQEIIELAGIDNYPSFIKTNSKIIKKKILKNNYIKDVKVNKKLFSKIYIKVQEKNILYRNEETNTIVLEDKTEINDNNKFSVPILLNYIPDTKYDTFINKMNEVDESIKQQVSEIRYYPNNQDEDRFLLTMNDGNIVYLTLTKFKQINYYEDVLEKLEGKKGILYLDSGNHFQIMDE